MKKSLLRLICLNFSVIFVFVCCIALFQGKQFVLVNSYSKNNGNEIEIIQYKTIEITNSSIPSNVKKVVKEGKNGISYINKNGEVTILEEPIDEEIVIGTGKNGIYYGNMTGYGPDCATCNGVGVTYCSTKDHKTFNIVKDGVYYNDDEYGKVRVLAGAKKEFPCGTIIQIENSNLGNFIGIVMDTGYDMNKFYENGKILFDVAYDTEQNYMIPKTTNMTGKVIYSVQRWGW